MTNNITDLSQRKAAIVAGVALIIITNLGNLLLPAHQTFIATIELVFMVPMIASEIGLALWLLFKGGK